MPVVNTSHGTVPNHRDLMIKVIWVSGCAVVPDSVRIPVQESWCQSVNSAGDRSGLKGVDHFRDASDGFGALDHPFVVGFDGEAGSMLNGWYRVAVHTDALCGTVKTIGPATGLIHAAGVVSKTYLLYPVVDRYAGTTIASGSVGGVVQAAENWLSR